MYRYQIHTPPLPIPVRTLLQHGRRAKGKRQRVRCADILSATSCPAGVRVPATVATARLVCAFPGICRASAKCNGSGGSLSVTSAIFWRRKNGNRHFFERRGEKTGKNGGKQWKTRKTGGKQGKNEEKRWKTETKYNLCVWRQYTVLTFVSMLFMCQLLGDLNDT